MYLYACVVCRSPRRSNVERDAQHIVLSFPNEYLIWHFSCDFEQVLFRGFQFTQGDDDIIGVLDVDVVSGEK